MNLRKALTTSAATIALCAAGSAQAGDYHLSVFGGWSSFDDEIPFQLTNTVGFTTPPATAAQAWFIGGPAACALGPLTVGGQACSISSVSKVGGTVAVSGVRGTVFTHTALSGTSNFSFEDEFEDGMVIGAAFGREMAPGIRAEFEVAYRQADISGPAKGTNVFEGNIAYLGYAKGAIGGALCGTPTPGYTCLSNPNGYLGVLVPISGVLTGTFAPGTGTLALPPNPLLAAGAPFSVPLVGALDTTVSGTAPSAGDFNAWSYMANVWIDMPFFGLMPDNIQPFIGGGAGLATVSFDYTATAPTYFSSILKGNVTVDASGDDTVMAYQLGGGLQWDLGGWGLSAQYRWFGTSDIDVGDTDFRIESHNVLVGLTWEFGN